MAQPWSKAADAIDAVKSIRSEKNPFDIYQEMIGEIQAANAARSSTATPTEQVEASVEAPPTTPDSSQWLPPPRKYAEILTASIALVTAVHGCGIIILLS